MTDSTTTATNSEQDLADLIVKIDKNLATRKDYKRYDLLLKEFGIDKGYIKRRLSYFNLESIAGFYYLRRFGHNKETESAILGIILGFGHSAIFINRLTIKSEWNG